MSTCFIAACRAHLWSFLASAVRERRKQQHTKRFGQSRVEDKTCFLSTAHRSLARLQDADLDVEDRRTVAALEVAAADLVRVPVLVVGTRRKAAQNGGVHGAVARMGLIITALCVFVCVCAREVWLGRCV